MAKAKSGGGITSRNLKQVGIRTGKKNEKVREGFAGQIGAALGDHVTDRRGSSSYRGESFGGSAALPSKLGNELVNNVGRGGPGAGYNLYGQCGSQGTYSDNGSRQKYLTPKPMEKGKDILSEFGPDYQRKGRFGK
jgi:hypothetical protein